MSDEFNYVVEVTDSYTGTPVFRGTVSQRGDFVHLQKSMYGSVATLRVHDMLAAAKVQQPVMVDPPADQSWLKMENA